MSGTGHGDAGISFLHPHPLHVCFLKTPKLFRIHSYASSACNSRRIHTYKTPSCNPFAFHSYRRGEGEYPGPAKILCSGECKPIQNRQLPLLLNTRPSRLCCGTGSRLIFLFNHLHSRGANRCCGTASRAHLPLSRFCPGTRNANRRNFNHFILSGADRCSGTAASCGSGKLFRICTWENTIPLSPISLDRTSPGRDYQPREARNRPPSGAISLIGYEHVRVSFRRWLK